MPRGTKKYPGWARSSITYEDADPTGDVSKKHTQEMVDILRSHADRIEADLERLEYFKIATLESDEVRAKRLAGEEGKP